MNFSCQTTSTVSFRRRHGRRQAFLYVAVLFTTLIVMVSVTAALTISTSNLRGETDRSSRGQALRFAESEIHRQASMMRTSSLWRSTATNNVFSAWHPITANGIDVTGSSLVRHRFYDSDGLLADDLTDSVELTVHAKVGRSEAAITVQLESDPAPLNLLRYSVTAADDMRFESGGALSCERPVQVFDDCKTDTWGILTTPQLACSGDLQMTLRGDLVGSSVTLPGYDVVAKYIALGTELPLGSIPQSDGDLVIQDQLLSPTANPFGVTDPAGIYWLDAGGRDVIISDCRFDATLSIQNAGQVEIRGGIVWNYPTNPDVILATNAPIRFTGVEATLDEAVRGRNFNPASSPYRQSLSNNTATDLYPTELQGVVYSSDDFRLDPLISNTSLHVTGAIVAKDVRIDGYVTVTQLDELLSVPPPGLSDPTPMRFVRGTFRRVASPQ